MIGNLESLELFVLIVEKGGMAAAGRQMGLSPATVSARVAALEEHYGARLLHRTTRSLSPTDEGLTLVEGARRVLAEMDGLASRLRLGTNELAGSIRVSAPIDLGRNWLVPLLDAFASEHPNLEFDLHLSDGYVDLAAGGFDLALRYGLLPDSTLRVRKLVSTPRVVCASPTYLERAGTPRTPEELSTHNCLSMRFGDALDSLWTFAIDGREIRVAVRGNRTSNDSELVRRWCIDGHGIARKSEADIGRDLDAGRLLRLLCEYEAGSSDIQLVYAAGRSQSRRVRTLIDYLYGARDSLQPQDRTSIVSS